MTKVNINALLLKTGFCCMACDGHIDDREVKTLIDLCKKDKGLKELNIKKELNSYIDSLNNAGNSFIQEYLLELKGSKLTEKQMLKVIELAVRTIKADNVIHYSEIKFFKTLRVQLQLSDETILAEFPDTEQFLEEDINITSPSSNMISSLLKEISLPKFNQLILNVDQLSK